VIGIQYPKGKVLQGKRKQTFAPVLNLINKVQNERLILE
jgi:hypothetical protein